MKVLMLATSVDSYRPGPDGFIVDWVRVLAKKVDKLTVLTYHYNPREKLSLNTTVIKINDANFFTRNVDLFFKTLKYARESDIIFPHILEIFGIVAGICGKITRKRSFFWYCQGYDLSKHFLAKTALFLVDKILTATAEIRDRYSLEVGNWIKHKTIVVGHGIYLPQYD